MIIQDGRSITEKQAYEAMLYFLISWYELTAETDLTNILSGGEYVAKDTPGDSAFWEYWQEAVNKVLNEGAPPLKVLKR